MLLRFVAYVLSEINLSQGMEQDRMRLSVHHNLATYLIVQGERNHSMSDPCVGQWTVLIMVSGSRKLKNLGI